MTVAVSIFLVAVGAVLYLATNRQLAHVNLEMVGLILMAAGVLGVILGLIQQAIWARRGRHAEVASDHARPTDFAP